MFMGNLAGPVGQASIRGQLVDRIILVKGISHSEEKEVVQVPDSLEIGLGIPGENIQNIMEMRRSASEADW